MTTSPIYKLRDWIDINNLDWDRLSLNPRSFNILGFYPDKINWTNYTYIYYNQDITEILKENHNNNIWDERSSSQNATDLELLKNNQDKINWFNLSSNPSIFILDYKAMKKNRHSMKEEILNVVFHHKRVNKYIIKYGHEYSLNI